MPRYFFHVEDHQRFLDREGTTLNGLAEARIEAVRVASAMLGDHANEFWDLGEWRVIVTDEQAKVLFGLKFAPIDADELPAEYDTSAGGGMTKTNLS